LFNNSYNDHALHAPYNHASFPRVYARAEFKRNTQNIVQN